MGHYSEKKVYHGTPKRFDSEYAVPRRNIRTRINERGNKEVVFDQESFHGTPHRWIALAYTYHPIPYKIDGKTAHYGMGVSLFEDTREVTILGFGSLEESLDKIYGQGGYVYHFGDDMFIYKEGLGDLEVISTEPVKPISIERIDDPVDEMLALGVKFKFIDLGLPENESRRNYF